MRLRIMVRVEAGYGQLVLWVREVERPYPGVPRPGESVFLGEDAGGDGLAPHVVTDLAWDNDGLVTLSFDIEEGEHEEAAEELTAMGYRQL